MCALKGEVDVYGIFPRVQTVSMPGRVMDLRGHAHTHIHDPRSVYSILLMFIMCIYPQE
jgi:hypothetical protein